MSAAASGRVAFLDAVEAEVVRARADDLRLAVAVAHDGGDELRRALESLSGRPVYAVGARSSAAVLPGLGRAEALGVLAKLEASCGVRGAAVELGGDETAVELVVRVLAAGRPPVEDRPAGRRSYPSSSEGTSGVSGSSGSSGS